MNEKQRAAQNRTLYLTEEERAVYLAKCLRYEEKHIGHLPLDSTIIGDACSVLELLPDGFADLLIADPPYNLEKTFGTNKFLKMDSLSYEKYTRKWIESALHTLKGSASVYVCCDWKTSLIIGRILPDYFTVQNRITWQREKGRGASANWKNSMEDIWFATVSKKYTFNVDAVKLRRKVKAPYRQQGKPKDWKETEDGKFRDTYPSNFWDDITIPFWSMPENTDHPTQKPEKLIAKLIMASSNPGDIVLDPFLGSGTTSVVAKKSGRRYIGIEWQEEYGALAEKRLKLACNDKSIQGYSGGVFWERNSLRDQKNAEKTD